MSRLYQFGPYVLDAQRRALYFEKSLVPLTPKAFDVLLFLAQNPNRLITKDELLHAVWGDTFVEEANLTQYISHLRKALADNSENSRLIVTISRKGYQFAADVVLSEGADIPKRDEAQVLTSVVSTPGIAVEAKAGNQSSQTGTPAITELPRAQGAVQKPGNRWRKAAVLSAFGVVLVVAGYISWQRFRAVPPPRSGKIMLAVLPFQNLTGDPKEEYLADGLTEQMISQLGRLHPEQLGVIGRTSVMGYKHSDQRLDQIGRELSVQYVLENSLRGSGDHLRVTVQLLQVRDQTHLWAQDYDYRPRDILSLEDDVARAVAREIQIRLTPEQQADLTRVRPVNPQAFDAYMEGRFFFDRDNNGDLKRAVSDYEQAIKLDSSYALAWVGLSRAHFRQADNGFVTPKEGQRKAREAVERGSLAQICFVMGRREEAEMGFKKAFELNPDLPAYRSLLGFVYLAQGRAQDALAEIEREPFAVLRLQGYAVVYYALGRKKESDTALSELIAKYQKNDAFQIAGVYAFRHEPDKAFEWLDRAYVQRDTGLAGTKAEPLLKNLHGDPRYIEFLKKLRLPL